MFHAHSEDQAFTIPQENYGERWEVVLDTAAPLVDDRPSAKAGETVSVEARSILVLRRVH
jgi:glycogen operon protein